MSKKKPIDRHYISAIDTALNEFNRQHTLSPAQQDEVNKYQRIHQLRDHAIAPQKDKVIWDFDSDSH